MIEFTSSDIFLVTGGSSGIGRAISLKLNSLGASVISVARNKENLGKSQELSSNPDNYHIEIIDLVDDVDSLPKWLDSIVEKYGKLKAMALSAAYTSVEPISICKIQNARDIFNVNYFANLALMKGFSKKKNNIGHLSNILIISSMISEIAIPGTVNYSASKGAINSAVRTLAVELARYGTRVNAISPGHIRTNLVNDKKINIDDYYKKIEPNYPLGLGKPEDVANLACFLMSDLASWITGVNYTIDGGASINFFK